jgi:hypothetical protein
MFFVTPGVVWPLTKSVQLIKEWRSAPGYITEKRQNIFSEQHIKYVEDLRWANASYTRSNFKSRFYYNKGTVLADEFFNYLTFLSPRLYFQSGDGGIFSPPGVEPIAGIYFLFFVFGISNLVKNKKYKIFYYIFIFSFLAYLTGRRNLAYLLPVTVLYLYVTYSGIINNKYKNRLLTVYVLISIFLLGRSLWLT